MLLLHQVTSLFLRLNRSEVPTDLKPISDLGLTVFSGVNFRTPYGMNLIVANISTRNRVGS
jgi:hypothetical protein